ncbi:MAG: S-methyl-5'-thioadenosine phosphorylase [Candidatus Bipolaricaulota bacterium]
MPSGNRSAKWAVIGGSGLYRLGLLEEPTSLTVHTPYGLHSPGLVVGRLGEIPVAFLPRHGEAHVFPPHRVPYRANLWALRELGVESIIALSAMGGLSGKHTVGDFALPDQFIDWTSGRPSTFFDGPVVVHPSLADPFCPRLRTLLAREAGELGEPVHESGTCLCFDGPRFSTRAESRMYREVLEADLLSMTLVPEVVLARELGMCYATCAVVTDLDARGAEPVQAHQVTEVMMGRAPALGRLLQEIAPQLPHRNCHCAAKPGT